MILNSAKLSGRGERFNKQKQDKPYMPKKAVKFGTRGRKNKYFKMHIDLTGSNKSPLDRSPPTPGILCYRRSHEADQNIRLQCGTQGRCIYIFLFTKYYVGRKIRDLKKGAKVQGKKKENWRGKEKWRSILEKRGKTGK